MLKFEYPPQPETTNWAEAYQKTIDRLAITYIKAGLSHTLREQEKRREIQEVGRIAGILIVANGGLSEGVHTPYGAVNYDVNAYCKSLTQGWDASVADMFARSFHEGAFDQQMTAKR